MKSLTLEWSRPNTKVNEKREKQHAQSTIINMIYKALNGKGKTKKQ